MWLKEKAYRKYESEPPLKGFLPSSQKRQNNFHLIKTGRRPMENISEKATK